MIVGYDSGAGSKPDPGPLVAAAERLGLAADEALYIGDSADDMCAAERAGMRRIAVLTGPTGAAVLAPLADAVLPSMADLPHWLAQPE